MDRHRNINVDSWCRFMFRTIRCYVGFVVLLMALFLFCDGASGQQPTKDAEEGTTTGAAYEDQCRWVFSSYEPSSWEKEWVLGEASGERRDRECEVLAGPDEVKRAVLLISAVNDMMQGKSGLSPESIDLFSRMIYARRCGKDLEDTGQRRVQLIEPLIGILRDPLTICLRPAGVDRKIYNSFGSDESHIQSKRFLLPGLLAPWTDSPTDPKSWRTGGFNPKGTGAANHGSSCVPKKVLMDIGASLYGGWKGSSDAAGARWFVNHFKQRQLAFDWIVSFEIEKHDPDEIYKSVPDDILPHYQYFNQGVEEAPNGRWNPWRILKGMGLTPSDYVVVKLDIDVPEIESALIDQVLAEEGIRGLVDEVFFEHHVNSKVMSRYWGTDNSSSTMKDSYELFTRLRNLGVRMHSWP